MTRPKYLIGPWGCATRRAWRADPYEASIGTVVGHIRAFLHTAAPTRSGTSRKRSVELSRFGLPPGEWMRAERVLVQMSDPDSFSTDGARLRMLGLMSGGDRG